MKRRLFNLAAAVSAVLCVAVCALWARSYFVQDTIAYNFSDERPGMNDVSLASSNGVLVVGYLAHPTALYPPGLRRYVGVPWSMRPTPTWRSFALDRGNQNGGRFWSLTWRSFAVDPGNQNGGRFWSLFVPHWAAALLTALLPALRLWRDHRGRRARQRQSEGRCPTCGYDLRATPERCPECGLSASAAERSDQPS
jgi:hypothetical protein